MPYYKTNIGSLFDRIASSYDRLNHLLSFNIDKRWRRQAVRKLRPCDKLLDVAIGTADLSIEVLRQQKAQHITGIDLSTEMMRLGKQKVDAYFTKHPTASDVLFLEASALDIPFPDDSFDAVTCSYGVRNFSDMDCGLNEMYRVLKPGGQLIIMDFGYPTNPLIRFVYNLYFSYILPTIGGWFSHDKEAYNYLNRSVKSFPFGDTMLARLRSAGFTSTTAHRQTFGISYIYCACK